MLTGYQCETIAFTHNGEILCPDCAVEETSAITVAKAERGLAHGGGDLSPLSRYGLDEHTGERTWEEASERVGRFQDEHPDIWGLLEAVHGNALEWRLTDRRAERHAWVETCGSCGREID